MRDDVHIMIVDDDEDTLGALRAVLSRSFRVTALSSSEHLENQVRDLRPSMLLLDYRMPVRDGATICAALRADPEFDTMPIVFLSALDTDDIRMACYKAGAEDFLTKPFDPSELRIKADVWSRLGERAAALAKKNRELEELAVRDSLTGLLSRRHVLELVDREIERLNRYGNPVAVVMIDIDDFKYINDRYGHAAGDEALRMASGTVADLLRKPDYVARYGGDEILVVLPNSDLRAAEAVCQKLQQKRIDWAFKDEAVDPLSLSIGAAAATEAPMTSGQLIDAADVAMLIAKKQGKGRYHVNRTGASTEIDKSLRDELKATRNSMREVLCQIIGSLLLQIDREGDVLIPRRDIMLALGERLALRLRLSPGDTLTLRNAIRIVGFESVGMPEEVALRREPPNGPQRARVREILRSNLGYLRETGFLEREADVLGGVPEWWDGSGLPDGLRGEEIPILARLLALLDAYAGETGEQDDTRLERILAQAGQRFDPGLCEAFREEVERYHAEHMERTTGAVLIVEDHAPVASILARRLSAVGFETETAASGEEARERFSQKTWRAVLLDIQLPDGNGIELCREFRSLPKSDGTLFLIMSSRSDAGATRGAEAAEADAFLIKPIPFETLTRYLSETPQLPRDERKFRVFYK